MTDTTDTHAPKPSPIRALPPLAQKVFIIGLDGATWDILKPMMDEGRMPNLARMVTEGAHGILDSTKPPITPAAWTTFMTGKGPGRHGIIDFERYDLDNNRLTFNSTREIREKTIWEILGEKQFRVGSIQLPMTYPPREVNGFLVSGFETPNTDVEFTHPPELKQLILEQIPDYSYRSDWKRKTLGGDELFQRNLEFINRSFSQGFELTRLCGEKYGWDVVMVLYKLVDNLQHKAWKYLDPRTGHLYPKRAKLAAQCFDALDKTLGDLAEYAQQHNALILMMSDHGHGSLDGKAQPNLLLKEWGYLRIKSGTGQAKRRLHKTLARMVGKVPKRFEAKLGIEHELDLDWAGTRACVMHAGIYGFLYLNLKGRQPGGTVEPEDYDRIRDELIERFTSVTCRNPHGETIQVFPEVHKSEELYNCSREEQPWMPDLLLVPQPGLAVVRKIRGSQPVRWSSQRRMEGTHRVEGIFVAHGDHVQPGAELHAHIADIAPTLLAALGLRVPADMEGRVLKEIFADELIIEHEPPHALERMAAEEVYSEAEKEALTKRLADLGYLE